MTRFLRWAPLLVVVLLFAPLIFTARNRMHARQDAAVKTEVQDSLARLAQLDSAKARQRRHDSVLVARRRGDPPLSKGRRTVRSDPRFTAGASTVGSRSRQPRGIP